MREGERGVEYIDSRNKFLEMRLFPDISTIIQDSLTNKRPYRPGGYKGSPRSRGSNSYQPGTPTPVKDIMVPTSLDAVKGTRFVPKEIVTQF